MKIIFLDIDGVLNSEIWFSKTAHLKGDSVFFDPRSIKVLNHITDETGAKIVVSSSWRNGRSVSALQELLSLMGVTGEIIGKTPRLQFTGLEGYDYSIPRGNEIKAWLETNKDVLSVKMSKVKYLILDDDTDMLYWQREKFIQVDPYCGLTWNMINRAKQILN